MIDNREYGLVLAGGGTKGAYQVGVWKALKELNINVKGIVGASIGSLNGALFLQDDFKMVEDMYENIKLGNIMNVDGMNENKNIFSLSNIFNLAADYTKQKGIDNTPLRNMIRKYINMDKIYNSNIDFGLVTFSVKNRQPLQVFKNEIPKEEYVDFNKKKIAEWVKIQEDLDIDVLVHGEFERNDMVEYFGEQLDGYVFTEKAWVQSYGTRCVKPPVIWGDVSRNHPMTVDWSVYAQSLTDRPMKGMLTGPVTILNWSFPREDVSIKESTYQIALAIRDEVLDLEKAGISVIQVDEAALREKLPLRKTDWYSQYLDWAIPSFRLVHSGVKAETQIHTHMCYSEFTDIITAIDDMDADVITFEASRSDLQILDSLKENNFKTEVGPGVYDIHSPRVPSTDEIKSALKKMLEKIDADKLWVNPDCGLKTRGEKETLASLYNLVKAAKELREEYK